jgi:hypothetical protein
METILEIINSISKPDFMEKFNFINDYVGLHINPNRYKGILEEWFLSRDLKIAMNFSVLLTKSEEHKSINRILKQNMFDKKGDHKENRTTALLEVLSQ